MRRGIPVIGGKGGLRNFLRLFMTVFNVQPKPRKTKTFILSHKYPNDLYTV